MMMANQKLQQHLAALCTILLWALGYVLNRIALQYFAPESLAFLRYFAAAVALLIFAVITHMRVPTIGDIPLFLFGGAVGFAVYVYALNIGAKTVTASMTSFIISSSPVITAVLAHMFLKERIGVLGWVSVLCAFIGVGIITMTSGIMLSTGIVWICLSAILISVYNVFQRKLLKKYSPIEVTTYCIVAGAILLFVFSKGATAQIIAAPIHQIAAVLILGVFSAGIAYACWAYALSKAQSTSEVTNYMFLTPLITTFLGYVLIDELPHASAFIGGGIVLLSVLLMNFRHKLIRRKR